MCVCVCVRVCERERERESRAAAELAMCLSKVSTKEDQEIRENSILSGRVKTGLLMTDTKIT